MDVIFSRISYESSAYTGFRILTGIPIIDIPIVFHPDLLRASYSDYVIQSLIKIIANPQIEESLCHFLLVGGRGQWFV